MTGLSAEERLDILDLYARQSHAIDGGDAAGWAATFLPGGVFESPTFKLTATGRPALEEFAKSSNDAALDRGEQLRHYVDSVVMRRESSSSVSVDAYLLIIATSRQSTRIDRSLRIEDELTLVDSRWLFARRVVIRDDTTLRMVRSQ